MKRKGGRFIQRWTESELPIKKKKRETVLESESEPVQKTEGVRKRKEGGGERQRELERVHKTMSALIFQLNVIYVLCWSP